MSSGPVLVVGVGMTTAVGVSAAETAASVRAGTARFAESRFHDKKLQPFILAGVPEDCLPGLAEGVVAAGLPAREARMLRLATGALRECLSVLPEADPSVGLILALPEATTARPLDDTAFLARLAEQTGRSFAPDLSDASYRGRAGGLVAVGQAAEMIRTGQARVVIVGGIDSYCDLYVLGTLDLEQRVKSSVNLDGFIPGEGAAFLVLAAANAGFPAMARLSSVVRTVEPGHLYSQEPYRGEGLAAAVQQLVQGGGAEGPIQEVYSSMNGESHWAKEWGLARIRNSPAFASEHGMHHPADCFGDLGAALGPALVGLCTLGMVGGYRQSPGLVYASSDTGDRAALLVTRA